MFFPIQMHREANLYDHYFSNFGRPPVPDDLSKDSAPRRREDFKRFLPYMGMAAILVNEPQPF